MILNAYPDSIGGNLGCCVKFLQNPQLTGIFRGFYILPSVFNTDLDRGFSIISYDINEAYAKEDDLNALRALGIGLKLDFVLNHASVLSKQFQDLLAYGEQSAYKDFFIDWNKFWDGYGSLTEKGYIQPDPAYLQDMFFRKPGLPLLMVAMDDGTEKPYWNTFYQEVKYPVFDPQDFTAALDVHYSVAQQLAEAANEALKNGIEPEDIDFGPYAHYREKSLRLIKSRRHYLGQMDLNIHSPLVWEFYDETLKRLAGYGAEIVRLDAFAYAPKEPGARNFLNEPATWDLLRRVRELAERYNLRLLPEIHAEYREKIHEKLGEEGFLTYDFFLPGLLIHAIERHTCDYLLTWAEDIRRKNLQTINMLGCHDGIPLLDLRGLLPDEEIDETINVIRGRGGHVKHVQGNKPMYYQVNATYFSALGECADKMLLARALQLFMPGIPQIWYLDLFCGKNDQEAVRRAGPGGHKEINRSNLSSRQAEDALREELVSEQLKLMALRNTHQAFKEGAVFKAEGNGHKLSLQWENSGHTAKLEADLQQHSYTITKT